MVLHLVCVELGAKPRCFPGVLWRTLVNVGRIEPVG